MIWHETVGNYFHNLILGFIKVVIHKFASKTIQSFYSRVSFRQFLVAVIIDCVHGALIVNSIDKSGALIISTIKNMIIFLINNRKFPAHITTISLYTLKVSIGRHL